MYYVGRYGQCDGDHHLKWLVDQIARILLGTQVMLTKASWTNGTSEYRVKLCDASAEYLKWRADDVDEYNEGIPP